MRKGLISILIIAVVSSLTAIFLSRALRDFVAPPAVKPILQKPSSRKDTVYLPINQSDRKEPIRNKTKEVSPIVGTTLKNSDQILHQLIETQNYLSSSEIKSLKELKTRYDNLHKYYRIKGLSRETNRQLKDCLDKIRVQEQLLTPGPKPLPSKEPLTTEPDTAIY